MGNALGIAQFGGTAPTAKPWKGLGPGVLEVVESHDGNAYRVDLVAERLKTAERDHEEHYGKSKR
jgi:phage-related protein